MRKLSRKLAILTAPLLVLVLFVAHVPNAEAATRAFVIYEKSTNPSVCIVALNNSIYDQGGCPDPLNVNHAGVWYADPEGTDDGPNGTGRPIVRLRNVHYTNVCITVNDTGGPYGAPCGTNHVQFWVSVPGNGGASLLVNIHTRMNLTWSASSSAITQTTGTGNNALWNFGVVDV